MALPDSNVTIHTNQHRDKLQDAAADFLRNTIDGMQTCLIPLHFLWPFYAP
jgi:hypothetical protein